MGSERSRKLFDTDDVIALRKYYVWDIFLFNDPVLFMFLETSWINLPKAVWLCKQYTYLRTQAVSSIF